MEKTFRIVSFQEAEELDIQYWKKATPEEKLDTLQALREIYYTFKNEEEKRIKKVIKIIQLKKYKPENFKVKKSNLKKIVIDGR